MNRSRSLYISRCWSGSANKAIEDARVVRCGSLLNCGLVKRGVEQESDGGMLENVIQRYLAKHNGPPGSMQHRLLMQAVHERRCLFLVDGVDEAGSAKKEIERSRSSYFKRR